MLKPQEFDEICQMLLLWQKDGLISELRLHPFYANYAADFSFKRNGKTVVVVDAEGYRRNCKMFLAKHPDLLFETKESLRELNYRWWWVPVKPHTSELA
jgi:hypothetical protein